MQLPTLLPRIALSLYLLPPIQFTPFLLTLLPDSTLPYILQTLPLPPLIATFFLYPTGYQITNTTTLSPTTCTLLILHVNLLLTSIYAGDLLRILPLYLYIAVLIGLRHVATTDVVLGCVRSAVVKATEEIGREGVDVNLVMARVFVEMLGRREGVGGVSGEEFAGVVGRVEGEMRASVPVAAPVSVTQRKERPKMLYQSLKTRYERHILALLARNQRVLPNLARN